MQLVCVDDQGKIISLEEATELEPGKTRELLFRHLFRHQLTSTDTWGTLHAEKTLRETLASFANPKEKPVLNFVLFRTLEPRIHSSPRGGLLDRFFVAAGPIAALGFFYATHDSRSAQSRKTLDYFTASDTAFMTIAHRANLYPCSLAVSDWLSSIFDHLSVDCHALICIFWHFGQAGAPLDLFRLARLSAQVWSPTGGLDSYAPGICHLLLSESRFDAALSQAVHAGFVRDTHMNGYIRIDPGIEKVFSERLAEPMWAAEVVRLVSYAFPKHGAQWIEGRASERQRLLPQMERAVSLLEAHPTSLPRERPCRVLLVQAILSASYLGSREWKYRAVRQAKNVAELIDEASSHKGILRAAAQTRYAFLGYMFRPSSAWEPQQSIVPTDDERSKALVLDHAILRAYECISTNSLAAAMRHLDEAAPAVEGSSLLLAIQRDRLQLMRAKVHRLACRFGEAAIALEGVTRPCSKFISLQAMVLGELGRYDAAVSTIQQNLAHMVSHVAQYRLQLALGGVMLCKSMCQLIREGSADAIQLLTIRRMFEGLAVGTRGQSLFSKLDALSVQVGLAMTWHLVDDANMALKMWDDALRSSREFLSEGYTDMICSYSRFELESRHSKGPRSVSDAVYVRELTSHSIGCNHLLGAKLWCDVLGQLLKSRGQDPLLPITGIIHEG